MWVPVAGHLQKANRHTAFTYFTYLHEGEHWYHLANTIDQSIGGDAAWGQITMADCFCSFYTPCLKKRPPFIFWITPSNIDRF